MTTAIVIVVVVVIVAALATAAVMTRRRRLKEQFGPEYERAVTEQNSKLRAEAELTDRQRRVRKLDIRPLDEAARRQYAADWMAIQEHFVDSPQAAVGEAHELVTTVMTERGYPTEDDDQVLADLSVEHAQTVGHFRAAQEISRSAAADQAAHRGPAPGVHSLPRPVLGPAWRGLGAEDRNDSGRNNDRA